MKSIKILPNELRAALLFASCGDSSRALNGVFIDCIKDRAPVIVATDGRILGAIEATTDVCVDTDGFIIERAFLASFLAMRVPKLDAKDKAPRFVMIKCDDDGETVSLECDGLCYTRKAIVKGNYPNWRQLPVPFDASTLNHYTVCDAKYYAIFLKAVSLLTISKDIASIIAFRSNDIISQVEMRSLRAPNLYAILMPFRWDCDEAGWQPSWLKSPNDSIRAQAVPAAS